MEEMGRSRSKSKSRSKSRSKKLPPTMMNDSDDEKIAVMAAKSVGGM